MRGLPWALVDSVGCRVAECTDTGPVSPNQSPGGVLGCWDWGCCGCADDVCASSCALARLLDGTRAVTWSVVSICYALLASEEQGPCMVRWRCTAQYRMAVAVLCFFVQRPCGFMPHPLGALMFMVQRTAALSHSALTRRNRHLIDWHAYLKHILKLGGRRLLP